MQSNTAYFEISKRAPETLDARYMFLDKECELSKYVECSTRIKDILDVIYSGNTSDENFSTLYDLVCSDYSVASELSCFINACDSTLATIRNDFDTFKKIVTLYLEHRDIPQQISSEMIQALIDKGASRAKGKIGEKKLIEIAMHYGFIECHNWSDFLHTPKAIAACSKGMFNNARILKHLHVDLNFGAQNKLLDVLIKNDRCLAFIEAKHLKEGGGSQDKQIKELIEIIKINNPHPNVYIAAFLDGVYSNTLLNIPADINNRMLHNNKVAEQQRDIIQTLRSIPKAYWLNTAGYTSFISDFSNLSCAV